MQQLSEAHSIQMPKTLQISSFGKRDSMIYRNSIGLNYQTA